MPNRPTLHLNRPKPRPAVQLDMLAQATNDTPAPSETRKTKVPQRRLGLPEPGPTRSTPRGMTDEELCQLAERLAGDCDACGDW